MFNLRKQSLTLNSLALIYFAVSLPLEASETPRKIYGWPLSEKGLSEIVLNQDALMGELVCPSLTRLNLATGQSESTLLQTVTESEQGRKWTFSLKPGVTWWGGTGVELADLEVYLKEELGPLVRKFLGDSEVVPNHKFEKTGSTLSVVFDKAPKFGPYILNRLPFYRRVKDVVECAGPLKASQDEKDIVLEGVLKSGPKKFVMKAGFPNFEAKDAFVSFRFGNELHPPSWERQIEEELSCPLPLELPVMTLIAWNPEGRYTRDEEFRRAMTFILPRGAMLRAGAGSLGDLISAPILRVHSGYKKSLLVLPYDLKRADAILNAMSLPRSEKDGFRRTVQGEILEITIAIDPSQNAGLLRKILDDSFRALGMRLKVTSDRAQADGILSGLEVSWPENDIAPILHSRISQKVWPWRYHFPEIDEALDAYNRDLTRLKPNFTLLERIHELVMKREPFSVLVQHKSCMQYGEGVKPAPGKPNVRDPDWIQAVLNR